jgi:outer membrane protein assembly factor BamB
LFYFSSLDGYLYAVHERTGSIVWTLALGEPLRQSPVVMEENLFVVGDNRTLFCRDSLTGSACGNIREFANFSPLVRSEFTASGEDGSLVILNRKSRALLGRMMSGHSIFA